MPAFYRDLASRPPGSITLIEAPARLISHFIPDPWYQAIHRQNIKYALLAPVVRRRGGRDSDTTATGTRFRRVGKLGRSVDGATWGADYLVLRMQPWSEPPGIEMAWPDMAACVAKVGARLGAPVYRDEQIAVFALGRRMERTGR